MASDARKIDFNEMTRILTVYLDGHDITVTTDVISFLEHLFPEGVVDGDPGAWGVILADAVRHAAATHHEMLSAVAEAQGETPPDSYEAFLARVREVMDRELDSPTTEASDFIYSDGQERGLN